MADTGKKHSAVFSQMLAQSLLERGFDVETIFRDTGLDAGLLQDDTPVADLVYSLKFFERAAVLTKNGNLGFQLGKLGDIRRAGLICYLGLAAPTVGGFLANFTRYSRVVSEVLEVDMSRLHGKGSIDWEYAISPRLTKRQYVEFSSAILLNTMRLFCTGTLTPRVVRFQHNRRAQVGELEDYYGCRVEFGAAQNGYDFFPQDLQQPLISADPHLLQVLQTCGDQVLAEMDRQKPSLVVEVERAIAAQLTVGSVTLETVATGLGMSPRTLSRKLAAKGTSFFRLLEDLRKSLSKSYLRESDLGLAEIAFLLGYSQLGSFNDAFKRWTGNSPSQFRVALSPGVWSRPV